MREEIISRLDDLRLHMQPLRWLLSHTRSMARDRLGRWYWIVIEEYSSEHFLVNLIRWPGLTAFRKSGGWLSVGKQKGEHGWMIFDVQVPWKDRQRGAGTLLVTAAMWHCYS